MSAVAFFAAWAAGVEMENVEPTGFLLLQNYPNPFNPVTNIAFKVGGTGNRQQAIGNRVVRLAVYDLLGREVAVLVDGQQEPGDYSATWDATGMPSGTYFCRMQVQPLEGNGGNFSAVQKLLLVR